MIPDVEHGIAWTWCRRLGAILLAIVPGLAGGADLGALRSAQDAEMQELRAAYEKVAREHVPRGPDGRVDTRSDEYAAVIESYSQSRAEVRAKYKALDAGTRGRDLEKTLDAYQGRIVNTGGKSAGDPIGMPKTVHADIDLAAQDLDAAKTLTRQWVGGKGGKPVEIYTLDNPRRPIKVSPENLDDVDWTRVVKTVNPNTDTTLWMPQTEELRRAKVGDFDAWTTPGGLKGTGNQAMPRDQRGFVLDNEKKLLHADRPVQAVSGAHDEELKTFAKSLSKGGQATGRVGEVPELYQQARTLQDYGDPYEAGIATLGEDSPAQAAAKVEEWKVRARKEFVEVKQSGQRLGDAADTAREELARQTRDAAARQKAAGRPNARSMEDTAEAIEQRRQLSAAGNRDAAFENRSLAAEADASYGGRRPGARPQVDAPDLPEGGGHAIAAATDQADELAGDVARIGKAKVTAIDGRTPSPKADLVGAAQKGLELGSQLYERTARQMGQAVDENRDLNAADAVAIGTDMLPGVAGYRATSQLLADRQVERLQRTERIAQLEAKPARTLAESLELTRLKHAEANNPDTALGNVGAMAKQGVAGYFDEMAQEARKAGRERPEFLRDGVPMFGRIARDAVNAVNPVGQIAVPLVEGAAEQSTYGARADWAGQKVEMAAYVNRKAMEADKRSQAMVSELDRLLQSGDLRDPARRQRVDELLAGLETNRNQFDKLLALANAHLGEVDPKELGYLRNVARSQPSVDALRDYAEQMKRESGAEPDASEGWGGAAGGFATEHGTEAEWGDGGFEDAPPDDESRIARIVALSENCEYRAAFKLAEELRQLAPDNAWLAGNRPAIAEWAQREEAYEQALRAAQRALGVPDLEGAISALRHAMANAASRCGQDEVLRGILDRALALAGDGGRQAAIDRAREDWRSTSAATAAAGAESAAGDAALMNSLSRLIGGFAAARAGASAPAGAGVDLDALYRNQNGRWAAEAARIKAADPAARLPKGYRPATTTPSATAEPRPAPQTSGGPGQGEFGLRECERTDLNSQIACRKAW